MDFGSRAGRCVEVTSCYNAVSEVVGQLGGLLCPGIDKARSTVTLCPQLPLQNGNGHWKCSPHFLKNWSE